MRLQAMMATYGIQTQTPHEVRFQNVTVQIFMNLYLFSFFCFLGRAYPDMVLY